MMTEFDPSYREILVERMDRLMAVLQRQGLSQTFLNDVTRGDRAWTRDYRNRDPRVGTYDLVFARLSGIWPVGVAWPEDIPRPAPADIAPDILADVRARLAKFKSTSTEHSNG